MPILEPLGDPNAQLTQGDLLKGVALFQTAKPRSGEFTHVRADAEFCLVISRPCVLAHKGQAVVAAVTRYTKQRPDFEDFDEALEFYEDARDGKSSPDLFYLGQIDGVTGSFCARLDSLHTIEIPAEPVKRGEYLAAYRVAKLNPDFARDMHQRIFRAFAQLGFDDQAWYSTDDLRAIVMRGRIELSQAKREEAEIELKLHTGSTQSFANAAEEGKLKKDLEAKVKKTQNLEAKLLPLEAELSRRDKLTTPPVGGMSDIIRVD